MTLGHVEDLIRSSFSRSQWSKINQISAFVVGGKAVSSANITRLKIISHKCSS